MKQISTRNAIPQVYLDFKGEYIKTSRVPFHCFILPFLQKWIPMRVFTALYVPVESSLVAFEPSSYFGQTWREKGKKALKEAKFPLNEKQKYKPMCARAFTYCPTTQSVTWGSPLIMQQCGFPSPDLKDNLFSAVLISLSALQPSP